MSHISYIRRAAYLAAAIAGSLSAHIGPALAAGNFNNPEDKKVMCQYYANEADFQARENIRLDCKGYGNDWGVGVDAHYNWCMTQRDTRNLNSGSTGRAAILNRCNTCQGYATARIKFEMQWNKRGCYQNDELRQMDRYRGADVTPRRLFMFTCMGFPRPSTTEMDQEQTNDNAALSQCQKVIEANEAGKPMARLVTSLTTSSFITALGEVTETAKSAPVLKTYQPPPPKRLISHKGKVPQPLPKRLISHKGKGPQPVTEIDPAAEDDSVVVVDTDEPGVEEVPAKKKRTELTEIDPAAEDDSEVIVDAENPAPKKRTELIVVGNRYVEVPAFSDEPAVDAGRVIKAGAAAVVVGSAAVGTGVVAAKVLDYADDYKGGITEGAAGAAEALKEKLKDRLGYGGFNTSRSDVVDAVKEKVKDGIKGTGISKAMSGTAEALKTKVKDRFTDTGGITKAMSGAKESLKYKLQERVASGGLMKKAASGLKEGFKSRLSRGGKGGGLMKGMAKAGGGLMRGLLRR